MSQTALTVNDQEPSSADNSLHTLHIGQSTHCIHLVMMVVGDGDGDGDDGCDEDDGGDDDDGNML